MLHIRFSAFKFLFKHRFVLGCLAITWITGTIISVFLISWKKQTKLEVQKAIHPTIYEEADHAQSVSNYKMAEAINYCNPPNTIKRGDEGKPPVNGSLEFVAVMFRHGDRGPLQPIRNQTTIDCGTTDDTLLKKYLNTFKNLGASSKQLPRRFKTFPLYPFTKHCALHQMTLLGAHQLLMVGKALKEAYIEEHNLLNTSWTSKDIKVYSTVYSRTFQSSLAFLFGFLPSFNISNIDIIAVQDHRFCMSKYFCKCSLAYHLEQVQIKKREQLSLYNSEIQNIMQQLVSIVKYIPQQLLILEPFAMFDAFMGYVCHAAPLPCIPGTNECATFEHLRSLITHLSWVEQQFIADSTERKTVVMKSQGFLNHLIYRINCYLNGKDLFRFVLYSAHDLSLHVLLSVLGIYDGGWIPYASHIAFEVYRHTENKNIVNYFLKIVYNGKDVTKDVSFCKHYLKQSSKLLNTPNYGFCPLNIFQEFVAGLTSTIGFSTFKTACDSQNVT